MKIKQKPTDEEMKTLLQTEYEKGKADAIAEIQKSWSEDDESWFREIELMCLYFSDDIDYRGKFSTWLKSLKGRVQPQNLTVTDEELAQAKKDAYNDALDKIEYHSGEPTFDDGWSAAIWYLKKKNAQPQSQWKPSDRDIKLLRELSDGKICPDNYRTRLYEIINNLKFL